MRRFLIDVEADSVSASLPAHGSTPLPPKRPRADFVVDADEIQKGESESKSLPIEQQHAFLDAGKRRDWASVRRMVTASPAIINVQPLGRWTVLHQAAEKGDPRVVTWLLERRADSTLTTTDGRTPLKVASSEAVRALLQRPPAPVPGCGSSAQTSLGGVVDTSLEPLVCEKVISAGSMEGERTVAEMEAGGNEEMWQVQSELLGDVWVDMCLERHALLSDAKAANIHKALFRDGGRSYVADLAAGTQTDLVAGSMRKIRLWKKDKVEVSNVPQPQPQAEHEEATKNRKLIRAIATPEKSEKPVACSEGIGATASAAVGPPGTSLPVGQTVEVQGSGATPYVLKNCGGGVWSCTCISWKMQGKKPEDQRSCKHIVAYRGQAAETARIGECKAFSSEGASDSGAQAGRAAKSTRVGPSSVGAKKEPALLLANKWEEKIDPMGWWISEKLDGMRAYWDPIDGCLFSRLGNPISCPKELLAGLPQVALDGELFLGRGRFQELMSVVKNSANADRVDGPWKDVIYVVFDMPGHGGKFEERVDAMRAQLSSQLPVDTQRFAHFHPHKLCRSRAHLEEELKTVQAQGGEGLMLRRPGSLYEKGRSSSLLKVKTFQDDEAIVIGHEEGKGRNVGVMGALRCRNREGSVFSVGTGFDDAQRANPPKVGEIITYRFFELTKDNKPRFPSYVGIRPDADRTGLAV